METVLRAAAVYVFLIVIFHFAGKRSLSQTNTFDLVLLLIISESIQQAMIRDDHSFTNAALVITTLVGLEIAMTWVKYKWPTIERYESGGPVILVQDGKPLQERLQKSRVDEEDILAAARQAHGFSRMDQIKLAILETGGQISIIPAAQTA